MQTSSENKIGGTDEQILLRTVYFQKVILLFIILFFSVILAILCTKSTSIIGLIFKEDDEDTNFDQDEIDFKSRWKKIIKLTFIFILFIILMHIAIFIIVFLAILIKISIITDDPDASYLNLAIEDFLQIFWEYTDPTTGQTVRLFSYYALLFGLLIMMTIFYMIYTLLVKGYFNNIYYEKVYNPKNPDADDISQTQKYIYRYGLYIVVMLLFIILLLNYEEFIDDKVIYIYNILFLIIYLILSVSIIRYNMQKSNLKFFIYLMLLLLTYISYPFILEQIAKFL